MAARLCLLITFCLIDTVFGSLAAAHGQFTDLAHMNMPLDGGHSTVQNATPPVPDDTRRPKVGLVLSGGGARGAAHVGVIKVLEELRVPIDFIAGTSMGAIVGGLYATGMSGAEIEAVMTTLDWADAFRDQIDREDRSFRRKRDDDLYLVKARAGFNKGEITLPTGILAGQKVDLVLKSLTLPASNVNDFDELSIPFRALATDIVTGKPVVIDSGDLAMAMRASMSIPAFFTPVNIDGNLLVDGGIANNLPIDAARDMGADVIIAVDISTPLRGRDELTSVISITDQLSGFLTRRNTEAQIDTLTGEDLLILPALGDITGGDFKRAVETIAIGVTATREHRDQLRQLAVSSNEYDLFLASRKVPKEQPPVIDFVRIENRSRLGDQVLAAGLDIPVGQPLDVAALDRDIGQLYGWQLFESVRYEVVDEDDETGLVLRVEERPWGPNYLQFGLALSDNFDGNNFFNLAVAYTRTGMNPLGGELRTAAAIGQEPGLGLEIYQPLDAGSRFFIHPQILYAQRSVSVFEAGNILSEFRVADYGLELAGGRNLGTWGEIRLGVRRFTGDAKVRIGDPTLMDFDFDRGEFFIRLSDDKFDSVQFPLKGHLNVVEWTASRDGWGSDEDFDQLLISSQYSRPVGKGSILLGLDYNTTFDNDAPVQSLFRTGGLFKISGFALDELAGQHNAVLRTGYLRRLGEVRGSIASLYLGGTLEVGNVWQDRNDIEFSNTITAGSVFLGADSPLGPLYLAYGRAEGGVDSLYLFVGQLF